MTSDILALATAAGVVTLSPAEQALRDFVDLIAAETRAGRTSPAVREALRIYREATA